MKFVVKQFAKMAMEHFLFPLVYFFYSFQKPQKGLVLFADAHHNDRPFSIRRMYHTIKGLKNEELEIKEYYMDFSAVSNLKSLKFSLKFMKDYAKAEYVFICDNFLPVSSCRKRKFTKVVQLWHSAGLLKKAGYDCKDSIPRFYKGEVFKNYDLLTVSAEPVVHILKSSMHQPEGVVKATGISRFDYYFSTRYNSVCRERFYAEYPQAKGKKIILWTPTFRGNAANPYIVGQEAVNNLAKNSDYFVIKKLHPHLKAENEIKFPSEQLFAVADLLITDYSSTLFDYLAYSKPFVLFAPDLEEFKRTRGFYVHYEDFPTTVVTDGENLPSAVEHELTCRDRETLKECYNYHCGMCDGKATERILKQIGFNI